MSVIYIILPLAILMAALAVAAFIWCARDGQLDDLQTPALRPLLDDLPTRPPTTPPGASSVPTPTPPLHEAQSHRQK